MIRERLRGVGIKSNSQMVFWGWLLLPVFPFPFICLLLLGLHRLSRQDPVLKTLSIWFGALMLAAIASLGMWVIQGYGPYGHLWPSILAIVGVTTFWGPLLVFHRMAARLWELAAAEAQEVTMAAEKETGRSSQRFSERLLLFVGVPWVSLALWCAVIGAGRRGLLSPVPFGVAMPLIVGGIISFIAIPVQLLRAAELYDELRKSNITRFEGRRPPGQRVNGR